jgi:hypothetical protein
LKYIKVAEQNIEILQCRLAKVGVNVSKEESCLIMLEILSNPDAADKIRELQKSLQEAIPVLTEL